MDLMEFIIVSRMDPEFSGEKIEFSKIDPGSLRRYHWSKGVQVTKVEEPPLGSLAVTGNLEESASHHYSW